MKNAGLKYGAMIGGVMFAFANFVACGARMYQVSLHEDTRLEATSNQEVSDPSSPNFGLHAPGGWTQLPISFRIGSDLSPEQTKGLVSAMTIWETAVGRRLFSYLGQHRGVTGDSFTDLYGSLPDLINGHYLDAHWDKTKKPREVLATTIWDNDASDYSRIKTADIRFNSNYYIIGDAFKSEATADREVVDMETLALHELGHLLGLAHVAGTVDRGSIMAPTVYIGEGLSNRRLSRGDMIRVQRIYGCEGTACDVERTLAQLNKMGHEPDSDEVAESGDADNGSLPEKLESEAH